MIRSNPHREISIRATCKNGRRIIRLLLVKVESIEACGFRLIGRSRCQIVARAFGKVGNRGSDLVATRMASTSVNLTQQRAIAGAILFTSTDSKEPSRFAHAHGSPDLWFARGDARC